MLDRMRKVTGALLGAAAVGAQIGNTLVCVAVILVGPAVVLGPLVR